eukprot:scaffold118157_cov49-Attheya_sp.AAC.4
MLNILCSWALQFWLGSLSWSATEATTTKFTTFQLTYDATRSGTSTSKSVKEFTTHVGKEILSLWDTTDADDGAADDALQILCAPTTCIVDETSKRGNQNHHLYLSASFPTEMEARIDVTATCPDAQEILIQAVSLLDEALFGKSSDPETETETETGARWSIRERSSLPIVPQLPSSLEEVLLANPNYRGKNRVALNDAQLWSYHTPQGGTEWPMLKPLCTQHYWDTCGQKGFSLFRKLHSPSFKRSGNTSLLTMQRSWVPTPLLWS